MAVVDLTAKRSIVTGGAQGIGAGIVQRLLDGGSVVAVWDLDERALADAEAQWSERSDGRVSLHCVDISDAAAVARAVVESHEALGGHANVLVNNAAIGGSGRPMQDVPIEEWERIIRVDLSAVFMVTQAVLPDMIAARRGSIVNISSNAGVEGNAGSVPYSAAKAGVIGLTKALARETAQHYINVNAIAPGLVETQMSIARGIDDAARAKVLWPRIGLSTDIGAVAAFLASDAAEYLTGQVIEAGGGSHM